MPRPRMAAVIASNLIPTCATQGVLNTVVVWAAALQVTEALKLLVRDPTAEYKLHAFDVWRGMAHSVAVERNPACVCCGERHFEFLSHSG